MRMTMQRAIDILGRFGHLQDFEAHEVMNFIISGGIPPSQIGAYLVALRMKGETSDEILGSARSLREHAVEVPMHDRDEVLDTCGTGGDQSGTFNVSTTVAFIAAAAGIKVAKHGNRASSSQCGSADVLEALGVRIELSPHSVARCIEKIGIGFMFAPAFHPALRHVMGVRRELKMRTIFNVLGPLVNPARAGRQLVGVFAPDMTDTFAHVLKKLGSKRAMVVSGYGGIDELTVTGYTQISELKHGEVQSYTIDPRKLGIRCASILDLEGGDARVNASILRGILAGEIQDARRDMALLNAAGAIYVGGRADSLESGLSIAADMVDSGKALNKLEAIIELTTQEA